MGYVYRGSDFGIKPKRGPKYEPKPFDPAHCGTTHGVTQHRRFNEPYCIKCGDVYNADRRAKRRAKKEG